jgi:methylisocitrate lyase
MAIVSSPLDGPGAVFEMLTRARLYDLVDYEAYNKFDSGIFNFQIPDTHLHKDCNEGVQHG